MYIPLADAQSIALRGQPVATAFLYRAPPATPPAGLKVMSQDAVKTDLLRPLEHAISSVGFVRILLWIVAATIIGSVLYLQATERTRDFAVFKATGTSTFAIGAGLALQAVALSLAAAVLAAVLATLLVPVFPMPLEISTRSFLLLPVITVSVGLLASLVALRQTADRATGPRVRRLTVTTTATDLRIDDLTVEYSKGGYTVRPARPPDRDASKRARSPCCSVRPDVARRRCCHAWRRSSNRRRDRSRSVARRSPG